MEGFVELESSLLTQPWASVCFGEATFLAKACFGDPGYILLISDLSSVWYERVDAEAVGQRSKELNKRLTVHVSSFVHRLSNLVCALLAGQPDVATSFSCHCTADSLSLHVKSEVSGLPFYWDFHCCLAPLEMGLKEVMDRKYLHVPGGPELYILTSFRGHTQESAWGLCGCELRVCCHLVRPLIRMSLALRYQVQELTSLLIQKDAEIEDYRESGAALSRDRLRTEPFQEESFHQNFVAESLPQVCGVGEGQAFTSALRQLYTAVTQQEAKQARKRLRSEDTEDQMPAGETKGHPSPLPPAQIDVSSSEGTTPVSSPVQKSRPPAAKAKPKKAKGLFS